MKSRITRIASIMLITLFSIFSSSQLYSSVFWELKAGNSTIYLLGSIHMGNESMYPLDTAIENRFDRADYLVTEIALDNIDASSLKDGMYYPKTDSLPLHIADTTYSKVLDYFSDKGLTRKMIRKMKPAAIVMTMMNIEYMKAGLSPFLGIDMHFTNKLGKKPLLQLETAESQMDVLNKMGDNPDEFINSTLLELPNMPAQVDTLIRAWKSGELSSLERLVIEQMKAESASEEEFTDELLHKRNYAMYDKIKEYMSSDSKYFVIVGAAHLLGDTGIIELLKKDGYQPIRK